MAKVKADTLLRKIQKGSSNLIQGASKFPGFKFNDSGGISLFKKREIVQPYLHPIDSRIVNEQVEKAVKAKLSNIDPKIAENYNKFLPSHLVNDLYSLYYNKSDKMRFEGLDATNKVKFDIIDSINNSLIKIVTNGSHISSYVYTEEIGKFLYKKFMELPPEQQQKLQDALNNCNQGGGDGKGKKQQQGGGDGGQEKDKNNQQKQQQGQGGGNQPGQGQPGNGRPDEDQDHSGEQDTKGDEQSSRNGDNQGRGGANNASGNSKTDYSQNAADQMDKDLKNTLDNLSNNLNSKQSQKELEQAFKEAEKKLEKLKDIGVDTENDEEMPEEERKEIMRNLNNLDGIRQSLSRLNVGKDKIMKAVEKILNGTTNYFSQKCIQNDVELFEADELLNINGVELLHPFFRKSRMFDLSVTERHYIGKFDLYVDCSGSMSSGCGGDLGNVCRIDLAKSLAMQMKELGILGDLYEFEGGVKKIPNTDMSILMMAARGGTNIEAVIQNVLKTGNNSVILSDGESHVGAYTHKALFIGIGTDFHYFKSYEGAGKKYVEMDQCIHYDGKNFVNSLYHNGIGTASRW